VIAAGNALDFVEAGNAPAHLGVWLIERRGEIHMMAVSLA
jgi:hypothetical protein